MKIQLRFSIALALIALALNSFAAPPVSTGSFLLVGLPNGTVLVAGGTDFFTGANSNPTPIDPTRASAEIYDPATGVWAPTGSMSLPRSVHTATLMPSGKVLVAGGLSSFVSVFPTTTKLYDPATGKWSPTLPLVSGHRDHVAALLPNGKVLVVGGFNTTDTGPTTELFDPASVVPINESLKQYEENTKQNPGNSPSAGTL